MHRYQHMATWVIKSRANVTPLKKTSKDIVTHLRIGKMKNVKIHKYLEIKHTLLNYQLVKEEIKREIKKHLKTETETQHTKIYDM